MEMSALQENCFDIVSCMMRCDFGTPQELSEKYGFTCRTFGGQTIVYTKVIEVGGERFIGRLSYKDNTFHHGMLSPITDIADSWQSQEKMLAEFRACDKAINAIGKHVGPFQIDIVKLASRDASSIVEEYALAIGLT